MVQEEDKGNIGSVDKRVSVKPVFGGQPQERRTMMNNMEFRVFLLLVIGGVFASTGVIVIAFILINKCISRKVAKYSATSTNHTKSSYEMGSTFKHNILDEVRPPLPPRDQFDKESMTNSYEEVDENPTLAEKTPSPQNHVNSGPPGTRIGFQDNCSASESYDDVEDVQNAQHRNEDVTSLADYLDVDRSNGQESDNGSESYDDVDQLHTDQEDYDDVG